MEKEIKQENKYVTRIKQGVLAATLVGIGIAQSGCDSILFPGYRERQLNRNIAEGYARIFSRGR